MNNDTVKWTLYIMLENIYISFEILKNTEFKPNSQNIKIETFQTTTRMI